MRVLWSEPAHFMDTFVYAATDYTPPEPPAVNPNGVFWTDDSQAVWTDDTDVEWVH
jgi:hypothetical protein